MRGRAVDAPTESQCHECRGPAKLLLASSGGDLGASRLRGLDPSDPVVTARGDRVTGFGTRKGVKAGAMLESVADVAICLQGGA
jgi:hypothetical protein